MSNDPTIGVAWRRISRAIDSSAAWLERVPLWTYGLLLAVAMVFRSGLYFLPHTNLEEPDGLQGVPWPDALGNAWLTLLKLLDVRERLHYEVLGLLSLAAAIALIVWAAGRYQRATSKWILILILLGPMGAVLTGFGRPDVFLVVGAVLFALGGERRVGTVIVGSVLIVVGNRMQSVALAIGLLLVVVAPQFRSWWRAAFTLLAVSVAGIVSEEVLASQTGRATQSGMFMENLRSSLEGFAVTTPYAIYSLYGIGWLVVIAALIALGWRSALPVAIALIGLPLAAMATTLDGMRVGVGVSALPFLVVALWLVRQMSDSLDQTTLQRALPAFLLVALVMPALNVGGGGVPAPWTYLWFSVEFWSDVLTRSS